MAALVTLTLAEASQLLEPPVTEQQLRQIITALGWKPARWRPRNGRGHPWPEYDATRIIRLHAALLPFLPLEQLLCAWYPMPGGRNYAPLADLAHRRPRHPPDHHPVGDARPPHGALMAPGRRDWQRWARRGTTEQRGYGHEHRRERERRLRRYRPGDICPHCGEPLAYWPLSVARRFLDLPHTADRSGYLPGLAHRSCNRGDGARYGNRIRGQASRWAAARRW